jgi:hypothetical protein
MSAKSAAWAFRVKMVNLWRSISCLAVAFCVVCVVSDGVFYKFHIYAYAREFLEKAVSNYTNYMAGSEPIRDPIGLPVLFGHGKNLPQMGPEGSQTPAKAF